MFGSCLALTAFWHLPKLINGFLWPLRHLPSECLLSISCVSPLCFLCPAEGWLDKMISGDLDGPRE